MKDLIVRHKDTRLKFKYLAWDTGFFGIDCFALDAAGLVLGKRLEGLREAISASLGGTFTVAKVPLDYSRDLRKLLLDAGFKYVSTEIILRFDGIRSLDNRPFSDKILTDAIIEKTGVLPDDAYLLGKEFELTRFHLDKNIPKKKADLLWVNYIKNFKPDARHHLFVARVKAKTAGGIFVKQYTENDKKVSSLFSVSVRRKYRGKRIGSALLGRAVAWCARHSDEVIVGTQLNNAGALNFYMKNGFSEIKDIKVILHRG